MLPAARAHRAREPRLVPRLAAPNVLKLLEHPHSRLYRLDYCQFGTPWRKRTKLAGWFTGDAPLLEALCSGRHGKCSMTGQAHMQLSGGDARGPFTRLAEPYPVRMAAAAARLLRRAADRVHLSHLFELGMG